MALISEITAFTKLLHEIVSSIRALLKSKNARFIDPMDLLRLKDALDSLCMELRPINVAEYDNSYIVSRIDYAIYLITLVDWQLLYLYYPKLRKQSQCAFNAEIVYSELARRKLLEIPSFIRDTPALKQAEATIVQIQRLQHSIKQEESTLSRDDMSACAKQLFEAVKEWAEALTIVLRENWTLKDWSRP
jgi:hypothetical protein